MLTRIAWFAFWAPSVVLHEAVQVGFRGLADRWGVPGLEAREAAVWVLLVVPAVGATSAVATWRYGLGAAVAWFGWALAVAAAWWTLVQTQAEGVHLPQYAAVALLLRRAGARPVPALAFASLLGALDEGWQAVVLYPERILDNNDVVLDALGAATGLGVERSWRRS